jgi:predicted metal-binding membrane protein
MTVRLTSARTTAATTLVLAAACWFVSIREMSGMSNMGAATELGSLWFFAGVWVAMMAAMMLPGALPAAARHVRADRRARTVPIFLASYLGVWTLVGLVTYAAYRPHGTSVAGALVVAAGIYELTPLKRRARAHCREGVRSGVGFGIYCVGSSIGLMLILVALGVMSVTWMALIALVVVAQKLLPANAAIDVPLALAIVALGVVFMIAPASVPGLSPA